jgi:pyruvate/2-oxoglutarate dehydrogenase complex dihydrolipoamide dehydrogenase (E3) component
MDVRHFDAVVIGAGQAGGPLAGALARAGRRTALVERAHVGGTCINVGCTPTKTMVASARVAYLARRGAAYGVCAGEVKVDLSAVRARKQAVVESFRSGSENRLIGAGVELVRGDARFLAPGRIAVRRNGGGDEELLTAERVFINSGARAATPRLPGIDQVDYLDSSSIMELDRVPEHLMVVGGGYIGLEFAQMFRRFGSAVSVVQHNPQLLPREDEDISVALAEILREDGIDLLLGAEPRRIGYGPAGEIRLSVSDVEGERVLEGTHVLVATGRVPNTEGLGLEHAGVETDSRGFIVVDERLETTAPGVFALGDVKGGPQFTHISYDDFRILRTNLLEGGSATTNGRQVPYTLFTDPQLGRVGMTEAEARAAGLRVRVASMPMSYVARAIEMGETRGMMKAVVDDASGRLLGVAVLGVEGGELMGTLQMAMTAGLSYTVLRDGIFAHPTLAESLNNLFATL